MKEKHEKNPKKQKNKNFDKDSSCPFFVGLHYLLRWNGICKIPSGVRI